MYWYTTESPVKAVCRRVVMSILMCGPWPRNRVCRVERSVEIRRLVGRLAAAGVVQVRRCPTPRSGGRGGGGRAVAGATSTTMRLALAILT